MQSKKVITGAQITAPSLSPVADSVIALVDLFPFSQSGTACLEPVRARTRVHVCSVTQVWPNPLSPVLVSQRRGPSQGRRCSPALVWDFNIPPTSTAPPAGQDEERRIGQEVGKQEENQWRVVKRVDSYLRRDTWEASVNEIHPCDYLKRYEVLIMIPRWFMAGPYETGEPRHLFTATDVIRPSLMLL